MATVCIKHDKTQYRLKMLRCPNCQHGRLCDVAAGKIKYHPPPDKPYFKIKCPKCGVYTRITIQ